ASPSVPYEYLAEKRCRSSALCGVNPSFNGLYPWDGQVAHALRTRAPLSPVIASYHRIPFDLHVLGLPLAFILSQDQTLHCKMKCKTLTIYLNNQNCLFLYSSVPVPVGQ